MFSYDMNSPIHYNMFNADKSWDGTTLYAPSTEPNLLKIKKLQLPLQNGVISPPKLPPSAFTHISSPDAWKPMPPSTAAVGTPFSSPVKKAVKKEEANDVKALSQDETDLNSLDAGAKSQEIESELTKQNLYKTELCRNWKETGVCRYGTKCQFAHGGDELRGVLRHPKYKTEICRQYHTTGACTYGKRCRFVHHVSEMGEGDSAKESEYSFQRQLAQLKFGDIMPSPNQSLFASPSNIPQEWLNEIEKLMGDFTIDGELNHQSALDKRIAEEEKMSAAHQSHEYSRRDAAKMNEHVSEQDSYHDSYDSTEDIASASCTETEEDSGEETSQEKRNKKKSRLSFFQKLHKEKRSKSSKKNVK